MTEPISWQIKVSDIMVAIDWKDITKIKKNVVFDHPSFANMIMDKKTDTLNLKNCLSQRLEKRKEVKDVICCSIATECQIEETIKSLPPRLNVKIK